VGVDDILTAGISDPLAALAAAVGVFVGSSGGRTPLLAPSLGPTGSADILIIRVVLFVVISGLRVILVLIIILPTCGVCICIGATMCQCIRDVVLLLMITMVACGCIQAGSSSRRMSFIINRHSNIGHRHGCRGLHCSTGSICGTEGGVSRCSRRWRRCSPGFGSLCFGGARQ
jgi:hypothetical protein